MFFYTISVAAAIFILLIVVFRLLIHFYFCRRISFRYPGERIKGCPIWTHTGSKGGKGENTASETLQQMNADSGHGGKGDSTPPLKGHNEQKFTNFFPAAPPSGR